METYKCLNQVLEEFKNEFSAAKLAEISGVRAATISDVRNGRKNIGIEGFDKIINGLAELCPEAYWRFYALKIGTKLNITNVVVNLPLYEQGEILQAIGKNRIFSRSARIKSIEVAG